jgi:hypothetical protein
MWRAMHRPVLGFPLRHIALGFVIREFLAPWTGHPYDFEIWARLGYYMQSLGTPYRTLPYVSAVSFAPYSSMGSIGYPPLSAFIFAGVYRLYLALGEPSRFLYYFLLKQPMVMADVGIALVLAKIILRSGNVALARRSFIIWLYLPFGIIISGIWGQLDPLALFLTLLSVYYFSASKWLSSSATLGLSIYLKALPVIFLPVFLMQSQMTRKNKLVYALVSLSLPTIGTLVPVWAFSWGYRGMYDTLSFQGVGPWNGEMSVLGQAYLIGQVYFTASPPLILRYLVASVWIPILLVAYAYIRRKHFTLIQGLVLTALVFSVSRSFLPEQWTIYPMAFLILAGKRDEMGHFLGLLVSSTAFLIANNALMIRFLSPVNPNAFFSDIFLNNQSLRFAIMVPLACLYLTESLLILFNRESILYRGILWATPAWLSGRRISTIEVSPA